MTSAVVASSRRSIAMTDFDTFRINAASARILIDSRGALEFSDTAVAYVVEFVFSACLLGMPRTGFGTCE